MDPDRPLPLLGGLSPQAFVRRHWQKRPLVVRGALAAGSAPLAARELFALAARDDVESRLVRRDGRAWRLRHGPFARRSLPRLAERGWTLLVQGVDLHVDAAHELLQRFRFVADARLDDVMVSYASDGGGVGPHEDSYDVFLLQARGRRRWRIGPLVDRATRPGLPLRVLRRFEPRDEWLLEEGDMLYLPPHWAHDGVAKGPCMTCSIGFRAPAASELARDVLARVLDAWQPAPRGAPYRDQGAAATADPARLPPALVGFAVDAVRRSLDDPRLIARALGELTSEPKPQVVFEAGRAIARGAGVRLDRRTRMLYDRTHLYVNGEAFAIGGSDARVMRNMARTRTLDPDQLERLSLQARGRIDDWARSGWLHPRGETR